MSRFDRTEAHVRETVRRLGDADCDTIHETLIGTAFELAEPRRRAGMIAELLEDGERLLRLAERSSQHPNGFSKLVLMGDEYDTFKVRLHLWWPDSVGPGGDDDTRNEVEHVHNHRWDFATVLLHGGYRHQEYERCESGSRLTEYRYGSAGHGSAFSLSELGAAHLRCVSDARLSAGHGYSLSHTVLHRVTSHRGQLSATLFVQGPARKQFTNVFATVPPVRAGSIPVRRLTTQAVAEQLRRLLAVT
jgi:hypothetical protein